LKNLTIIIFLLTTALCNCQEAVFDVKYPVVKFPKTEEGIKQNFKFEFTNSGDIPLEIYSFDAGCTCLNVSIPKSKIEPGGFGEIVVTFDTNNQLYHQDRIILVNTNSSKRREKLRIKIYVEPKSKSKN
jgi:hypothetical protein